MADAANGMSGRLLASPSQEEHTDPVGLSRHPLWRWNVSRHAQSFRSADAFVVSVPKSGRTWVRVFLLAYFAERAKLDPGYLSPRCAFTHDRWEHQTKGGTFDWLRGKWLIPGGAAAVKPVLLVVRDPRDVIVSLFFHLRKRAHCYDGELPDLLRHPVFGVQQVVSVMNGWLAEWSGPGHLHLLRYEDARINPHAAFADTLRFLQPEAEPHSQAINRAVEISSFANMRRLEAGDTRAPGSKLVASLRQEILRPADRSDADSYKVRRGKVGGYVDYLSTADVTFLDEEVARLDPRFGYAPLRV